MEVIVGDAYRTFRPLLKAAAPGSIVIDCGANVGFFGLWASRQNPGITIYAFEPHPQTFEDLVEHIALNQESARIIAENMAVGGKPGILELELRQDTNMVTIGESFDHQSIRSTAVKIPVITIDEYCALHNLHPSLLKIDVEGYELEVLKGAKLTLPKLAAVILEAHSPELLSGCTQCLREHGFRTKEIDGLLLGER
jgi:FkbM family methyltransferase